ncbi:hypothetical protein AB1A64_09010 [Ruegeria sp. ANG10]|uniref:hypothetical protein n=1 Tax=Ruegeria sp. ANG10 TaxID=3042467 RepID=UPI0034568F9B
MNKFRIEFLSIASSLVWFCTGYAALSENAPEDIWEHCQTSETCTIEYDHLSNQEDEPYLFLGYVMEPEQARWEQFREAIQTYPDVKSCLLKDEQNKEVPNLLKFDWARVGTGDGAAVCVFRVTRSLGDPDRIQNWFKYHEFEVAGPYRYFSEDFVPTSENQPVATMTGYWTTEQYRRHTPSLIAKLVGLDAVRRYEIILSISYENQVVGSTTIRIVK